MGRAVGIDLGTTNSLVAYYTEDGPKIIPNRLGENLTPSVVSIDEEESNFPILLQNLRTLVSW